MYLKFHMLDLCVRIFIIFAVFGFANLNWEGGKNLWVSRRGEQNLLLWLGASQPNLYLARRINGMELFYLEYKLSFK